MTGKLSYSRRNAEAIFADVAAAWEAQVLEESNKPRSAVNWGACLAAAAVATTLVGAAVARADDDDRHWKRKRVYAPPPIVYYPAPMAYAPAYGPPAVNFGLTVPLR
jgi:hypothetical protein